jgi:membrane protease YdiL (CAAX protease family)
MSSSGNADQENFDDDDDDDAFPFDMKTAGSLVGGQSLLIVAGVAMAWLLQTPHFGFHGCYSMTTTMLHAAAQPVVAVSVLQAGFLYTIPLVILAVVLEFVEAYIPALQDVSAATQRSVLLLLGGRFRPVIGTITAILLGVAAGVGEELIFRGIFQYELAHRIVNWLPFLSSLGGATAATAATTSSVGAAAATVAVSSNANNVLAILLSSLVFGGLHAVTKWYAILATLASLYFGFMFASTGNLAVPIICHSLYDIGALLYAHWTVSQMSRQEQQAVADWDG